MKIKSSHPQLEVDQEFIEICQQILGENKSFEEWDELESDDMFQSQKYCGGYDATEQAFTFSYFERSGKEWWFQVPYEDIASICNGELKYFDLREAEK